MIEFLTNEWQLCIVIYTVVNYIVKLSPTKTDDIILDLIWGNLKKISKK
jgi:hypothetical protein